MFELIVLGLVFFCALGESVFVNDTRLAEYPRVIRIACEELSYDGVRSADASREMAIRAFRDLHWHPRKDGSGRCELETHISGARLTQLRRAAGPGLAVRELPNQDAMAFLRFQESRKRVALSDDEDGGYSHEDEATDQYHDIDRLGRFMKAVDRECANIARTSVVGTSHDGHPLYVVRIAENPDKNVAGKPEVKYVGNMHGDETVGRELLINLIRLLCRNYDTDPKIHSLVNAVDLYVMVTMNPDGFERHRRENGNNVDLNRNFPDQYSFPNFDVDSPPYTSQQLAEAEPETAAVMKWSMGRNFVISANLHGGSIVANYPWDGNREHRSGVYAPTPDDESYKRMAHTYARNNPDMVGSREFRGGITNGVMWYALYGGMQDWNYLWTGDQELTIEVSYRKFPDGSDLPGFWKANKKALLAFIELSTAMGVRGVVNSENGAEPLAAVLTVKSADGQWQGHWVHTDPETGDYFKMLDKGEYSITARAKGYESQTQTVKTKEPGTGQSVLNFVLKPKAGP